VALSKNPQLQENKIAGVQQMPKEVNTTATTSKVASFYAKKKEKQFLDCQYFLIICGCGKISQNWNKIGKSNSFYKFCSFGNKLNPAMELQSDHHSPPF
jgi:hypothetical protein